MQQERPDRLAGGTLGRERHICALISNRDEEHRVLRSFFTEGLDRGDKAVHVAGPEQRHHHVARLREAGIDGEQAVARGQLDVLAWTDAYLRGDRFDQDAMRGGILQQNPFIVPPDQFLLELRERGAARQETRPLH
jgi:MEDS: MEthanogen/methylotroph, DcmR Sensory domain